MEECGDILQFTQGGHILERQKQKQHQRSIRRLKEREVMNKRKKECLKAAKGPAAQFDKFAELSSSTEEDGDIPRVAQAAQMLQEQKQKRIIRRLEDKKEKTFFEEEWLKSAKSPASQFNKFAELSSSFGVKLSLKWSKCPDTGKQQGNFNFSKVLMLSERFVATITTVNTSKICFTAVLGRIDSMILQHRKITREV